MTPANMVRSDDTIRNPDNTFKVPIMNGGFGVLGASDLPEG